MARARATGRPVSADWLCSERSSARQTLSTRTINDVSTLLGSVAPCPGDGWHREEEKVEMRLVDERTRNAGAVASPPRHL